jgi:HPt (histidine-containing phosphotransfer) domain-containing protein
MTQKETAEAYLKQQLCVDDQSVIDDIYNEFIPAFKKNLAEANEAFAKKDWEALATAAHTLKGDTAIVGLMTLRELAMELQSAGKSADADACERLLAALKENFVEE